MPEPHPQVRETSGCFSIWQTGPPVPCLMMTKMTKRPPPRVPPHRGSGQDGSEGSEMPNPTGQPTVDRCVWLSRGPLLNVA